MKSKKRKNNRYSAILTIILMICATAYVLFFSEPSSFDGDLQVIVLDVGQADCILVRTDGRAMLIDAGNLGQDDLVLGYLEEYGVTELDYLVATHPHADHIGAMAAVVRKMNKIGTLLMPDVIQTTAVFERLISAIEEKDIFVTNPVPGDTYEMGGAIIQVLAPSNSKYDDLNNFSIVLRIEYNNVSFLLTGDAEGLSENEQLSLELTLNADVLKVGHHGSSSSTIKKYLEAVSPTYAVISCGVDNSYGHPHKEIIERLSSQGTDIYRTDKNGTVIFTTDGDTISIDTKK